jgi:hypothetical protein
MSCKSNIYKETLKSISLYVKNFCKNIFKNVSANVFGSFTFLAKKVRMFAFCKILTDPPTK